MLSDIQLTYAQSLINTYRRSGYNDYILVEATRSTQNNQPYNMFLYLTKGKFTAQSVNSFEADDSVLRVSIDTSSYSTTNNDSMLKYEILNNTLVTLQDYYATYTNAEYTETAIYRQPDLLEREGVIKDEINVIALLLFVAVLTAVFIRILR